MSARQAAVLAMAVLAGQVRADDKPAQGSAFDVLKSVAESDLSVPESPAFALLGITPNAVQRPGTIREVVTSVSQGLDTNGKVKLGMAVDFAPLPALAPEMIRGGEKYANDPLVQAMARTTISLATADAGGVAARYAWGLRVGIIDRGDAGLYADKLAGCIRKVDVFGGPPPAKPNVDGPTKAQATVTSESIATCSAQVRLGLWAKPAWYAGYGRSWYTASGALKDGQSAAQALWTTFSIGRDLGSTRALLLLHAERKLDDRVADPSDSERLVREDRGGVAARLRLGAEKWRLHLELGRSRVRRDQAEVSSVRQTGVGAELQINERTWLQMARTMESGFTSGGSVNKVTAGVRFGDVPFLAQP